ncbi:MAG: tRNA lysidine(34) synthetase TilS [Roseobacter sp.]
MSQALLQALDDHFAGDVPDMIGVAVSGGSDSLSLLHLMYDFCQKSSVSLHCVTVDHRLRTAAATEAQFVAQVCADLNVPHTLLEWTGWDGTGNTQDAARRARYQLMSEWAVSTGIDHIALGHTQDDQAETVVMRLGRGAGVDGLSAMAPRRFANGVHWDRPLLGQSRQVLRSYLKARGQGWVDDPSNEDERYDRIKARQALDALADLGIARGTLAQVASHMATARAALRHQTLDAAKAYVTMDRGALRFDLAGLQAVPVEISRRLLVCAVQWISRSEYPPRSRSIDAVHRAIHHQGSATLEGCRFLVQHDHLWVFRELNAVVDEVTQIHEQWDQRWQIIGPHQEPGLHIGALGEMGLPACDGWRDLGLPRALLLSTPAIWRGTEMIAAPLVISGSGWQAALKTDASSYLEAIIAH